MWCRFYLVWLLFGIPSLHGSSFLPSTVRPIIATYGLTISASVYIIYNMEYGSTPYIGMAPKKMAAPLYVYKVIYSKLCPRLSHKLLWTIPVILRVFSTVTRLLTLTDSIAEVTNRQVAKPANRLSSSFFRAYSTKMTEAITMIQMRRSAPGSGLLHPHHSVLKQIKPCGSDSQALEASTCRYTPFCSVPFCVLNGGYAYTGNAALSTSCSASLRTIIILGA